MIEIVVKTDGHEEKRDYKDGKGIIWVVDLGEKAVTGMIGMGSILDVNALGIAIVKSIPSMVTELISRLNVPEDIAKIIVNANIDSMLAAIEESRHENARHKPDMPSNLSDILTKNVNPNTPDVLMEILKNLTESVEQRG